MIRFIKNLPRKCTIAFSGGIDSVVIFDFLSRGKRDIDLAFFHHGTVNSDQAEKFVQSFANKHNLRLQVGRISSDRPADVSPEEFWRNERYKFLHSLSGPVITGHHLDDAVETWIFTSLHGQSKLIPYSKENVIRPFLLTPKSEFKDWAKRKDLSWCEDESNEDLKYMRNLIRHKIVPEALKVNPGLRTVLKKKYEELNL